MIGVTCSYFEKYGEIEAIDFQAKDNRLHGFVQFKSAVNAKKILLKSRHRIKNCEISVAAADRLVQPDYMEYSSNPLFFAPAQDSPSNILNKLIDDCFIEIFKRLDLPDLVNVAEVCTHFNGLAKKTFLSTKYKQMDFKDTEFDKQPNKMRKVLRHFGENMHSLRISAQRPRTISNYLLAAIVEHCTELKELDLSSFSIHQDSPNGGPTFFSRLEKLRMSFCQVNIKLEQAMAHCDGIKYLRFDKCRLEANDECIVRVFGNLKDAHFCNTNFSAEHMTRFIDMNPTVTALTIEKCGGGGGWPSLGLISQKMPNLQYLDISTPHDQSSFQNDVVAIAQLTQLKHLKLNFNGMNAAPLLSALVANNVPILRLCIIKGRMYDDAVTCIVEMKQLEKLQLNRTHVRNRHLIQIAKALTELQELRLGMAEYFDVATLKKIIENGKKLKEMSLEECDELTIDIGDFNEMLHTVQRRPEKNFRMEIDYSVTVNIRKNILKTHRDVIKIDTPDMESDDSSDSDMESDDSSDSDSESTDSSSSFFGSDGNSSSDIESDDYRNSDMEIHDSTSADMGSDENSSTNSEMDV